MAKRPSALTGARMVGQHLVRSQRQRNPEGRMPLIDRRRARTHPDPYAGLADDELSPLPLQDAGTRLT